MADTNRTAEAVRRAVDTLLRNARSRSVMLRIPAPAAPGSDAEQLGLTTPLFQDIELVNAVFRTATAHVTQKGTTERELFVSATVIDTLTSSHNFASADVLFASAAGVLVDDALLAIVSTNEIEAGGQVCGYRLKLREPHQGSPLSLA